MLGCDGRGTIGSLSTWRQPGCRWFGRRTRASAGSGFVLITMGLWVAMFVTMAVIPSYWLYFADGTSSGRDASPSPTASASSTYAGDPSDIIVVLWYGLALGAFGVGVHMANKRKPEDANR